MAGEEEPRLSRWPLCIYKVQSDGGLHFVEGMQTFDEARERVRELGEVWAGDYVIEDSETRKRIFVNTRNERPN